LQFVIATKFAIDSPYRASNWNKKFFHVCVLCVCCLCVLFAIWNYPIASLDIRQQVFSRKVKKVLCLADAHVDRVKAL
jgi:hypothetical protein